MSECWICAQEKVGGALCKQHHAATIEPNELDVADCAVTLEEARGVIRRMEQERDLLRRQLEILLLRIDKMAEDEAEDIGSGSCCNTCEAASRDCGEKCVERMREWSFGQAKEGGGGEGMTLEEHIEEFARTLPIGWGVRIEVERYAASVIAVRPDGTEVEMGDGDDTIHTQFVNAGRLANEVKE